MKKRILCPNCRSPALAAECTVCNGSGFVTPRSPPTPSPREIEKKRLHALQLANKLDGVLKGLKVILSDPTVQSSLKERIHSAVQGLSAERASIMQLMTSLERAGGLERLLKKAEGYRTEAIKVRDAKIRPKAVQASGTHAFRNPSLFACDPDGIPDLWLARTVFSEPDEVIERNVAAYKKSMHQLVIDYGSKLPDRVVWRSLEFCEFHFRRQNLIRMKLINGRMMPDPEFHRPPTVSEPDMRQGVVPRPKLRRTRVALKPVVVKVADPPVSVKRRKRSKMRTVDLDISGHRSIKRKVREQRKAKSRAGRPGSDSRSPSEARDATPWNTQLADQLQQKLQSETSQDATRGYHVFRDPPHGQFGSAPSYDDYGDEGEA